jgi:xanthine/CO dehydrogenase XdhC/CoxF family maturation factor
MKRMMEMLGGASAAGFVAAATFALAPVAHAEASGSRHSGVVQMMFEDGSVRSIRSTTQAMSAVTWWAALTPSGGEVRSSDW